MSAELLVRNKSQVEEHQRRGLDEIGSHRSPERALDISPVDERQRGLGYNDADTKALKGRKTIRSTVFQLPNGSPAPGILDFQIANFTQR